MNIAFLQRSFTKTTREAAKITSIALAKEFKKKKNDTAIITEGGYLYGERLPKHELVDGIPVYRPYFFPWPMKKAPSLIYWMNYFLAPASGVRYVQKRTKTTFDIIHSISSAPVLVLMGYFAKLFSRKAKLVHSIKSESLYGYSFARLLNLANMVIVPLEMIKHELVKRGCDKNKIWIIRSSINTEKFGTLDKAVMKAKYHFKDKKVVFYYGGFTENKGVDDLLRAVPYIVEQEPDAKIILVHPDRIAEKYRALVDSLGKYKKNVELRIEKLNVKEFLNAVDILVLPYVDLKATEANPSCLLEGMACKTPIVTTSLPELKEIVEPNKDVLMAQPGNPKSIAENVLKLLNNRKLQKRLTENAYKKIKEFDIKKIAQQHLELYDEVMGR